MLITGSLTVDFIAVSIAICFAIYLYVTRNFTFWKKLGVTYVEPLPFVGSLKDVALQRKSIGHFLKNLYDEYKGQKYVGLYSFDKPAVMVRDLDIIKNVLVKDAQTFVDRVADMDDELDPLGGRNLFVMRGHKWKQMRNTLSPTFTSGKMKNMFYLMDRCAQEFDKYIDEAAKYGAPVEIKECSAKFTTDVIASCAFGIDSNSLKDPQSEFRVYLRKVFEFSPLRSFAAVIAFFAPRLLKILRLKIMDSSVDDFVRRTMWTTAKYREENGINRKDFLDNLMELKKKNTAMLESTETNGNDMGIFKMEDDDYAAQALSFLTAGFETSSSTMSFTLYELALHPEIQTRVREEICDVLQKHNNQLTYDGILEMKYLDMVVNEAMRKFPILPFLDRKCLQPYEFPAPSGKGTITIPAGTGVYIPMLGIHYDPEYFPEPDKFDPERFSEENKEKRPKYTHMPFGEGPRICIGMRFGLMQTKAGLIHILSRYEVSPCKDTPIPLVLNEKSFLLQTTGGIPLTFKRVKT